MLLQAQVLLLTARLVASIAASARSDAFIGYSESLTLDSAGAGCQDKEDRCKAWQIDGQCLVNPYYMRFNCPLSCQVSACTGSEAIPWKGHATEFHTKQYANRSVSQLQLIKQDSDSRTSDCTSIASGAVLAGCLDSELHSAHSVTSWVLPLAELSYRRCLAYCRQKGDARHIRLLQGCHSK